MRRREIQTPRPDYREKIERYGLSFHILRGRPYWYESAAYRLDPAEVTVLQAQPTNSKNDAWKRSKR